MLKKSRNFNIHSKLVPYRWIVRQVGYTIAMMFLKSYEQGERVHKSMISRGFSDTSQLFNEKTQLEKIRLHLFNFHNNPHDCY